MSLLSIVQAIHTGQPIFVSSLRSSANATKIGGGFESVH